MNIARTLWHWLEAVVRFFLLKVFRLKLNEGQMQAFLQFVRFGLVGLNNTIISFVIYAVSLTIFQKIGWFPRFDYQVANILQFLISVFCSYVLNSLFVFKKEENAKRNPVATLLKTYAAYAFTGIFLNMLLSYVWVDIVGLPKLIAPIINLLFSVPINFFINKFWTFRSKKIKADA